MIQRLVIDGRLDGLNEYVNACRTHAMVGARVKKENQEFVERYIQIEKIKPAKTPVHIVFSWYEKNKRRDKDNIASAKKYILDALVKQGIIKNDTWDCIQGFEDKFCIDKENPRVCVDIMEV